MSSPVIEDTRKQFGSRCLTNEQDVFKHNAWDNIDWSEEQREAAAAAVALTSEVVMSQEQLDAVEEESAANWDKFYGVHQNRFYKNRNWLFIEFPELRRDAPQQPTAASLERLKEQTLIDGVNKRTQSLPGGCPNAPPTAHHNGEQDFVAGSDGSNRRKASSDVRLPSQSGSSAATTVPTALEKVVSNVTEFEQPVSGLQDGTATAGVKSPAQSLKIDDAGSGLCVFPSEKNDSGSAGAHQRQPAHLAPLAPSPAEASDSTTGSDHASSEHLTVSGGSSEGDYPGHSASFRVLEIGCGVGNTIFPVLEGNIDPGLFVYGGDFSATAIDIIRQHQEYDTDRCRVFVLDVTDPAWPVPFPPESLDVITSIFLLSAVHPDKHAHVARQVARYLRPGGVLLFRDYGRYDMAQLRFKKGKCLADNFYLRGEGTKSYFFAKEDVRRIFTGAGLEEKKIFEDKRLQVNRKNQKQMYRVSIQARFMKPLVAS